MKKIIKNMQFTDPKTGSKLRVNDSTFKSLRPVGGQIVSSITLEDIKSGEDVKYTFDEFNKFTPVISYALIGFRADLVMKDGSVKVSDVYLYADMNESNAGNMVVHVDEHLQLSDDGIDYVVLKYINGVKYDREGTTEVAVSNIYDMYGSVSGIGVDNGNDTHLLSGGNTKKYVVARNIYNPQYVMNIPTYKDFAKNIFSHDIYIAISQSFTPWGVIPTMYILDTAVNRTQAFTVLGNRMLQIADIMNIYNITETELAISIDDEKDIAAAVETGIRMFNEWAYDYSFFIEPIRKYFAE